MYRSASLLCLALISLSHKASAESAEAKPEITISGFFDGYYSYNFNRPKPVTTPSTASVSGASLPPTNNTYRYYDTYHNQMTLNLAELTIQARYQEVSALLDLDFGAYADLNSQSPYPSSAVVDESSKNIGQAIVSYHAKESRFYFDAGKMYSHLGVETAKSKDNINYSRSILFSYAMPFWATGVRLGYDLIPERLQGNLYIYNGWNVINDVNESKTIGAQFKWTPNPQLSLVYNFIGGPERADTESDLRAVHELNASWTISDSWSLIYDLIYGSEPNVLVGTERVFAKWYGGLVGAKYSLNPKSFVAARFEIYRDDQGYTLSGRPQTIQSGTLTYGKEITQGLQFRAEARADISGESSFTSKNGTEKSQSTILTALLFKF